MAARAFYSSGFRFLKIICYLLISCFSYSVMAENEIVDFDLSMLKARGLPTTLNDYFRDGKKFSPGVNKITPIINGTENKAISLHFDEKGKLCLYSDDLSALGIKAPKSESGKCIDLSSLYPQSEIKLDPGANKVIFVLPSEAIEDEHNLDVSQYTTGGTAAMLNYDLLMMKNKNKSK